MKKHFIFFLLPLVFSCTSEGKFDESYDGDTNIVLEPTIDTFSVKKGKPLTAEEKNEIERDKKEVDSITAGLSAIINQGNTGNDDIISNDDGGIVSNPDVGPSFPGGQDAMIAYIAKKKVYPLAAFQNEIKGVVMIKFVVEKDGKIGGIKVLRGLGYGCDESAIDLVRGMPRWTPGQKSGAGVRCAVTLPITFGQ